MVLSTKIPPFFFYIGCSLQAGFVGENPGRVRETEEGVHSVEEERDAIQVPRHSSEAKKDFERKTLELSGGKAGTTSMVEEMVTWAAFLVGCPEEFPGCRSSHMKRFVASRVVDNGCSSGFVSAAKSVPKGVVWRYKFLWPLLDC
ncbi:hypothetical protein EV1_040319 [Malus domestica]